MKCNRDCFNCPYSDCKAPSTYKIADECKDIEKSISGTKKKKAASRLASEHGAENITITA